MPKVVKAKKAYSQPTRHQPFRRSARREPCFPQFLQLPRELRDQVYGYLLYINGAIDFASVWDDLPNIPTSIFLTNRQVSEESLYFFYNNNTFSFLEACDDFREDRNDASKNRLVIWLGKIGKPNKLRIRRLQLRLRDERDIGYYEALLKWMADELPNVFHLGLIMERHQAIRNSSVWYPNFIASMDEDKLYKLYEAVRSLDLKSITLAGRMSELGFLETFPPYFQCQVRIVEPKFIERNVPGCASIFEQKPWYTSQAIRYGS